MYKTLVVLPILFFLQSFSQKEIMANKRVTTISLDGKLDELQWKNTKWYSGFTQMRPFPGEVPSKETKVSMLYDEEAVYFGIKCFDHPDSLSKVLSIRDDFNPNLDVFAIFIDTYQDNQNGFMFALTSRGVQLDAKIFNSEFNDLFNLVWRSKTEINDEGWFAEVKIPYSALRFPKSEIQNWNINFGRQISRFREEVTWMPVNPDLENYLLESGSVKGIKDVSPPLRLALIPFVSSYTSFSRDSEVFSTYNGGMDVKYGINEAFTLDVTLLPDFGQVIFDQQVLNISPFEIRFNENRQFFTEGTELFNKSGLFYSRRIGVQTPSKVYQSQLNDNEELTEIPTSVPLINASKISGRLNNGLGIGIFNGVTAEQKAIAFNSYDSSNREIVVSPLSNYNVLVLDQNLKNNGFITFTNTNVSRAGEFYDANVSGISTKFNSKNNDYFIETQAVVSNIINLNENSIGHTWGMEAGKQRGNLTYGIEYYEESDRYNPNDLGFLRANNSRVSEISIGYRNFNPKNRKLNKYFTSASFSSEWLYAPNLFGGNFWNARATMISNSFNATGLRLSGTINESNDYFEPRGENIGEEKFIRPVWTSLRAWFSSNYQKRFALDVGLGYVFVERNDWWEWNYDFETRFRITNQLFFIHTWEQRFQNNSEGYAVNFGTPEYSHNGIIFGNRDRINTTQTISIDYTLTNRIGLTFRLRNYNAIVNYNSFSELLSSGRLDYLENYTGNDENGQSVYDINYNAFTIDMLFRWVFFPGSEINIVWKNSIFSNNEKVNQNYWNTLFNSLEDGPMNTFSVKLIYWLDAQYLKKKK